MHNTKRSRTLWGGIVALGAALLLSFIFYLRDIQRAAPVVVGKGSRMLTDASAWETAVDQARARDLALANENVGLLLAGKDFGFLSALPLTRAEALQRPAGGCMAGGEESVCAHVTFYDYSDGGTVDAIVNLETGQLLESTVNPDARPGASPNVVPRALAIAAADPRVNEVLGDVRQAEPVMGPMSGWLMDDACREDWCVDLTFAAPDGSGRTFHVFVNMERDEVARVFYSRSRAERAFDGPAAQRFWDNGCREQYGWSVCWEMTAHDGVEFRDATYDGASVFSNIKMGQIEVFYPSWPGGYRDEIGYAASVQPADGTQVTDLGDGFEVRQLFTEFLSWPNCVCCYRYDQILRFYADGSFAFHFISHGPGCDDPMIYRAFWRIDLDLDGPINEELQVWGDEGWVEAETELRLPIFGNLSPEGEVLVTSGGQFHYRWRPLPSDPVGNDDGLIFLLRRNEGEGEGEIIAGPPDTFWPPGQWLNGETLSDQNIVIWYISILNGRKGDPWWCAPEPAPDFSPCDAEMRVERFFEPTPTPTPTANAVGSPGPSTVETVPAAPTTTPLPTTTPTASATTTPSAHAAVGPTSTPRPIGGETIEELAGVAGCDNCHLIGDIGEAGKVGPDLSAIGSLADQRVPGQSAVEYLRTSIVEPEAFLAPNCPNGPCLAGIMPTDYAQRLTADQIDQLVDFLLEQKAASTSTEQAPLGFASPVGLAAFLSVTLALILVVLLGLRGMRGRETES